MIVQNRGGRSTAGTSYHMPYALMDIKPHHHHKQYIRALRGMTADQRICKAFELTELGKSVLADGLRPLFRLFRERIPPSLSSAPHQMSQQELLTQVVRPLEEGWASVSDC